MGCLCSRGSDDWPEDFTPTELSSNKCDSEWENINGDMATFAMGSHWGACARFGSVPGVIRVRVGFAGGSGSDPSYDDPKDHSEAVDLKFDRDRVTYKQLLEVFWDYHDWTESSTQYASIIFFHNTSQKKAAEESLQDLIKDTDKKVRTKIQSYTTFYVADDEFQHYLLQQQKKVFDRLRIPLNQLAHSHLACRVEGYVCGYSPPEMFDDDVAELYIPDGLASLIRKICVRNQPPEEGADKFPL